MEFKTHTGSLIILGLGNPILGDDGVGWQVAKAVKSQLVHLHERFDLPQYEIDFLCVGGLGLMERLIGYDFAILIDAMLTGKSDHGTVSIYHLDDLPNRALGHLTSSHDTTLQNALEIGRQLGAHLPESILIVGIEADNGFEFSEELSPRIKKAVPIAADQIVNILIKDISNASIFMPSTEGNHI